MPMAFNPYAPASSMVFNPYLQQANSQYDTNKAQESETERALLEMSKELRMAKDEATYATQRLADVLVNFHREKANSSRNVSSPQRKSPEKQSKSPRKRYSLRSLKASPIIRSSKMKKTSESFNADAEDDEYSYDEDDFDEESNLNFSVGHLPAKTSNESKEDTGVTTNDEEILEEKKYVHPPLSSIRNSQEILKNTKHKNHDVPLVHRYDAPLSYTSNRESFDGILRASQGLFQRQLAAIRDRLEGINRSTANDVATSLHLPNYRPSAQILSSSGRNTSSSLSDMKTELQTQRKLQQEKLLKALYAVDPTLSMEDAANLVAKYS